MPSCLFAQDLQSQEVEPVKAFDQLQKLRGGWFQASDQGDIVEEWESVDAQNLTGSNYRIRVTDGDTAGQKSYQISLRPDGVFYTARFRAINNNEPLDFKLVLVEDFIGQRSFTFENKKYEYPQKITYTLIDNRDMVIKYEGERNGRPRVEESNYQREFSAAETEMYFRFGLGAFQMKTEGFFFRDPDEKEPSYALRPGWDLGAQLVFKGRGNFAKFGLELGLAGRYTYLDSASFTRIGLTDTVFFLRDDVRYTQTRIYVAFTPELRLDKNDKISIYLGPYVAQQLITRAKGTILPTGSKTALFDANNDLKKTDFGIIGGLNFRLNPWKKDMGGRLGLRAWMGLSNQDNLYTQGCTQCTGKVTQRGLSVSYMVNLLKS